MFARLVALCVVGASVGCANEYHPDYHPQSAYSVEQNVNYGTVVQFTSPPPTPAYAPPEAPSYVPPGAPSEAQLAQADPSHVLVLEGTHPDRPAQVVGVVDAHVPAGSHDAALDALRRRAAAMGADAVVGVEFHRGEGAGQPIRVSGLAIRFAHSAPHPVEP
jgi:hypothetical protein